MSKGPSTNTEAYLISTLPGVNFTSIVTVGDPMPDAQAGDDDGPFAGIPDGLGAFDNGDGTITVLVNHELREATGSVRDHGFTGAFIDRLVIDKETLAVVSSDDLIKSALVWNTASDSYVAATAPIGRLCSADLPEVTAFFNDSSDLGATARIYLTGEETGDNGRLFATVVNGSDAGTSYELPFLGNMSYENAVANPYAQDKTIVALTDDQSGGQIYVYVGQKQDTGIEIARAGLTGGDLYGIKVDGLPTELGATGASGTFSLQQMGVDGDVSDMNGTQLQADSVAEGVTAFLRPEDAAWDPDNPSVLYFVTTGNPGLNQPSRLYKLSFDDVTNPEAGGTIEMLLQGVGGPGEVKMLDNMTVADGKIILQEDPGNDARLAKVWEYDIDSGDLVELAQFDPVLFTSGQPGFLTQDEESSGVIDVTGLLGDAGSRVYLLDAQVHKATDPATTVEMGQLLVMSIDTETQLEGGNGDDSLEGNGSGETFRGGKGDDVILGWGGDDFIYGGIGADLLRGGTGADRIEGELGDDRLDGGFGEDQLLGGNGSDWLIGGGDADLLTGGKGGDLFLFDNRGETGDDIVTDFSAGDLILTTVSLGDGLIEVDGGTLNLFGTSSVQLNNGGKTVSALAELGTVELEGTTYHSYMVADYFG